MSEFTMPESIGLTTKQLATISKAVADATEKGRDVSRLRIDQITPQEGALHGAVVASFTSWKGTGGDSEEHCVIISAQGRVIADAERDDSRFDW